MAVHRTAAISLLLALVSLSLVPAGLTQPGVAQAPALEAIGQIGGWSPCASPRKPRCSCRL